MRKLIIVGMLMSTVLGGISLQVGARHLTVDRLLIVVLALPICLLLLPSPRSEQRETVLSRYKGTGLVLCWCIVLGWSTYLTDNAAAHLPGYLISIEPVVVYLLFSRSPLRATTICRVTEWILWYLSVGGIGIYILWIVARPGLISGMIDRNRIDLTLVEPNIFGATIGYFLILNFPSFRPTLRYYVLYSLCLLALLLSFSRAPYVAFLAGLVAYLFSRGYLRKAKVRLAAILVAGGLFFTVVVFSEVLLRLYADKLSRSNSMRTVTILFAFKRFLAHPLVGNGALDFGFRARHLLWIAGSTNSQDVWIWNMFMAVAHDTGVVGLGIYSTFLIGLLRHGYRLSRVSRQHCAYFAGFVLLLLASQTTTLHLTVLFGIASGLLGSGLAREPDDRVQGKAPWGIQSITPKWSALPGKSIWAEVSQRK